MRREGRGGGRSDVRAEVAVFLRDLTFLTSQLTLKTLNLWDPSLPTPRHFRAAAGGFYTH